MVHKIKQGCINCESIEEVTVGSAAENQNLCDACFQEKEADADRKLLNSLLASGFVADCEDEVCHFVEVKVTDKVNDVFKTLGKEDVLNVNKTTNEDGLEVIDLCTVAWDYADWFTGDEFVSKDCA